MLSTFTEEQDAAVQEFINIVIYKEKMINEIQKLLFDKSFYGRHLYAHGFKIDTAIQHLKNYFDWRKNQNIDTILVSAPYPTLTFVNRTSNSSSLRRSKLFVPTASTAATRWADPS